MRCEELADHLAAAEGGHLLEPTAEAHVQSCLRCQAELAQYRKLLRALRTLRTEVLKPAPGLVSDILVSIEAAGERSAVRSALKGRRMAYLGGVAVAGVAGGAAALVLVSRRRMRLAS